MAINNQQIACQKIISGGQTGVDRGALDACIEKSFLCGGWCPASRLAEDGPIDKKYPLKETAESDYSYRTIKNIEDSDGTLIISHETISGGTLLTLQVAKEKSKPFIIINSFHHTKKKIIFQILDWLNENHILILNVAGPRESEWKEGYRKSKCIISGLIDTLVKNSSL